MLLTDPILADKQIFDDYFLKLIVKMAFIVESPQKRLEDNSPALIFVAEIVIILK